MSTHPAAVLRRAATLARTVLPPALARMTADRLNAELAALSPGGAAVDVEGGVLDAAQEILGLLPEDFVERAAREVKEAQWRPLSPEVAADLLNLLDDWESEAHECGITEFVEQIRAVLYDPALSPY